MSHMGFRKVCMNNKIVIGIDQSYKDTGIAISFNRKLMSATDCFTLDLKCNSMKRDKLKLKCKEVFSKSKALSIKHNADIYVVVERIRLQSQGFVNIDYIKSIGALNACIVDIAKHYDLSVYSVDTRAWKSRIIGTSKGKSNKYGFDEKKWPTILWCIENGYEKYIYEDVIGKKKKKAVIENNGKRFTYNDNIADSIGICLCGAYLPIDSQLLKEEH
jgi:hypothetical protein